MNYEFLCQQCVEKEPRGKKLAKIEIHIDNEQSIGDETPIKTENEESPELEAIKEEPLDNSDPLLE